MFDTSNREKYGIIYTGAGGEKDLPSRKNLQKQNKNFSANVLPNSSRKRVQRRGAVRT